jgi:hypothetical protein
MDRLYVFCMVIQVNNPGELMAAANRTTDGLLNPIAEKKRYLEGHVKQALTTILEPGSIPGCEIIEVSVTRPR